MSVTLSDASVATTPLQRIRAALEHTKTDAPRVTLRKDDVQTVLGFVDSEFRAADYRLIDLNQATDRVHYLECVIKYDRDFNALRATSLDRMKKTAVDLKAAVGAITVSRNNYMTGYIRFRSAAKFWRHAATTVACVGTAGWLLFALNALGH